MEKIYLDTSTLSSLKKIKAVQNNESDIYINGDVIYKIIDPEFRDGNRQTTIEILSNYSHPNCVFPKDMLMDSKNDELLGLTEEYLKGYITLSKALQKNTLSFEERKNLAYLICDTQNYLNKEGIAFIDLLLNNIMIKGNDMKIIDLDSSRIVKPNNGYDYFEEYTNLLISKNLTRVCYMLLLGKDITNIIGNDINSYLGKNIKLYGHNIEELFLKSNTKQQELLQMVFSSSNIIDPRCYIEEFNEQYMEESKLILQRKNGTNRINR